jgi:transposase
MNYSQVIAIYYKNNLTGGCTAIDFISFLQMLEIPDGYFLFLDNATVHNNNLVNNYIENKQWNVINNVPYSCDFNAIEFLFNIVKQKIRSSPLRLPLNIYFADECAKIKTPIIKSFVDKVYDRFRNIHYY